MQKNKMSFSSDTKNELARIVPEKKCCMLGEIAGFIRVAGSIKLAGRGRFTIVLSTENPAIARHYKKLIKDYFSVDVSLEIGRGTMLKKGKYYLMSLGPEELSEQILRETGILMIREGMNYISDGIYQGLIKTKCCRKAYLRGLFLGAGTMSNPEKAYQFEIVCKAEALASDVKRLMNSFVDIHARIFRRKKEYVVYTKAAQEVTDILAIMGAHSQYFVFEDIKLKKELRNRTNRINNCDQANIDKAVAASERQIESVKKIDDVSGLSSMPGKLKEIALLRLENPDATMTELGEMMDPPLKKSGVAARMKRIEELAKKGK